jgi:hypothetical protein
VENEWTCGTGEVDLSAWCPAGGRVHSPLIWTWMQMITSYAPRGMKRQTSDAWKIFLQNRIDSHSLLKIDLRDRE